MSANDKPWSGRFSEGTDRFVEEFTASVAFDRRLYRHDIAGSIAHARMLAAVGVLTEDEGKRIVEGLQAIERDIEAGRFEWSVGLEDVHMNIEARLTERIGEAGKKLHTGRSRNDQVATDVRLFLRDAIDAIDGALKALQAAILQIAEGEVETPMPGFTHLQIAQPVSFAHHMLAWFEMLARDRARFSDCRTRVNIMPLGAAALAGTSYPIDRALTAKLLGFSAPAENSLDAVSDRDFALEFAAAASIAMMHLSRFAEELILWSTVQFGFIDLPDKFCTGSSIMPQKKNPDVPELVRGKTGRVYGHLMALLTLMKAQPLAYNKDNQEDKEPLFDTVDTLLGCLKAFAAMLPAMKIERARMAQQAVAGFATATDLADYLVRKGVPFRDAHEAVGRSVRFAIAQGRDLQALTLAELKGFHSSIEEDVFAVLTVEGSIAQRRHLGGTAFEQVAQAIARARARL